MDAVVKSIVLICFTLYLMPKSTAGPNECPYYRSVTEVRYHRRSSSYTECCGFLCWGRCQKHRYHKERRYYSSTRAYSDCCHGWRRGWNNLCTIPICRPSCQNGGQCYQPNRCLCPANGVYYGEYDYCSLTCPSIEYCSAHNCNRRGVTCRTCRSNISPTLMAYQKSPDAKKCLERCSWKDNWCWPGYCTGNASAPDRCTCAPGFSESPKCLTITNYPNVLSTDVVLEDPVNNQSFKYTYSSPATVYTNAMPDKVSVRLRAQFVGPQIGSNSSSSSLWKTDYRTYRSPPWISDFLVGIINANVKLISRQSSEGSTDIFSETSQVIHQHVLHCKQDDTSVTPSSRNPVTLVDCTYTYNLSRSTFEYNDKLNVVLQVANGGYIQIKNMDHPLNPTSTHYYSGRTKEVVAPFVFDRELPVHCSLLPGISCPSNINSSTMLSVDGKQVRKKSHVTVSWDDWFDTPGGTGLVKYSLEIYKMAHNGYALTEKGDPLLRFNFNTSVKTYTLSLDQSGLYSIVLYVYDATGNYRIARRMVLYDESSTVSIDVNSPLTFRREIKSGKDTWKTVNNGRLYIRWSGHFYNQFIRRDLLLRRIADFRQTIASDYDQPLTGSLGRRGTASYAGIVRYKYATSYGPNPQQPKEWEFRDVLHFWQHHTVFTRMSDGDQITVWVKAIDVWGNSAVDSIKVNVDFSAPNIAHVGFTRDGETVLKYLNLHVSHTIRVKLNVNDPQSGVTLVRWKFGQTKGGSERGNGSLLELSNSQLGCGQPNCSCDTSLRCESFTYILEWDVDQFFIGVDGEHSRSYYLTIEAKNTAGLLSLREETIKVIHQEKIACMGCG